MLTQAELKEEVSYDPLTGIFTRLKSNCGRVKVGDIAGSVDGCYIKFKIYGKLYKAHRLAFLYMTGKFPEHVTDHINGNGLDNRWCNLREATVIENLRNTNKYKNNTSGYKGVSYIKKRKKYQAQSSLKNKDIFLGYYETAELAHKAYVEYVTKNHGEFAKY